GTSEKTIWDRESRQRLPKYVWITETGWKMLGVDLVKLQEQQRKRLAESEIRLQLIKEGVIREGEEISVHSARKRWYAQRSLDAIKSRRKKAAERKRANRLAKLPYDEQRNEIARFILKR
ncbi:plasmid replication initiator RepA, partial [Escherichia coli]